MRRWRPPIWTPSPIRPSDSSPGGDALCGPSCHLSDDRDRVGSSRRRRDQPQCRATSVFPTPSTRRAARGGGDLAIDPFPRRAPPLNASLRVLRRRAAAQPPGTHWSVTGRHHAANSPRRRSRAFNARAATQHLLELRRMMVEHCRLLTDRERARKQRTCPCRVATRHDPCARRQRDRSRACQARRMEECLRRRAVALRAPCVLALC